MMMHQIKKKLHESGQQKEDINLLCCFGVAQHNVEAVDSGRVSLTGQLLILEWPWRVKPGYYRLGVPGIQGDGAKSHPALRRGAGVKSVHVDGEEVVTDIEEVEVHVFTHGDCHVLHRTVRISIYSWKYNKISVRQFFLQLSFYQDVHEYYR